MDTLRRLSIAVGGLLSITAIGTGGYVLVEDLTWLDALYMTVITMSTVGYGEVQALSRTGQLFTIGLILTSVGFVLYSLAVLAEILVEGRLRELFPGRRMERSLEEIRDHVIVCGFGRFGQVVADDLTRQGVPVVVIEKDPARMPELERRSILYLCDSALSDEALQRAGIERARAIVIATASDSDNVFVALSAREHNPKIRIHARGESDTAVRRLRLAGADRVVSAYSVWGQRVSASILRPSVVDFLEIARPRYGEGVDLEEVHVHSSSPLVGATVAAIEKVAPRVRVVALKRGGESIRLIPDEAAEVGPDDHLVVIGSCESLVDLSRRAGPA